MFRVNNKFRETNVPHTIRFTETLSDQLHRVAHDNSVSFNALVLQCCQYALDSMEDKSETPPKA